MAQVQRLIDFQRSKTSHEKRRIENGYVNALFTQHISRNRIIFYVTKVFQVTGVQVGDIDRSQETVLRAVNVSCTKRY
jgi:hypothetical protein